MKPLFIRFGSAHLLTLALTAVLSALAFRSARSRQISNFYSALGVTFACTALTLWGLRLVDGFQANRDLPLWLCDIIFILCALAFFKNSSLNLIFVTYWGLAGTLQALITPDLLYSFPSKEFLMFFTGHSLIVITIFFLLGRHRPPQISSLASVAKAMLGLITYTAIVGGCDLYFNWNYGYLISKPIHPSILDKLGPWPLYVPLALLIAAALFLLIAGLLKLLWKILENGSEQH